MVPSIIIKTAKDVLFHCGCASGTVSSALKSTLNVFPQIIDLHEVVILCISFKFLSFLK